MRLLRPTLIIASVLIAFTAIAAKPAPPACTVTSGDPYVTVSGEADDGRIEIQAWLNDNTATEVEEGGVVTADGTASGGSYSVPVMLVTGGRYNIFVYEDRAHGKDPLLAVCFFTR